MLITVVVFGIMGEAYHFFILSNIKSMSVSLNYPGAEQGLNPDGSRFNISEMSNDEIINEAKSGLKMSKLSNDDIKSRLFITTKFSQKAMENVLSDLRSGMQGSYVPTTYYIYYSQKDKFAVNETYEFLQALAESYERYFTRKHAENNKILEYGSKNYDFSDYDYSEIYTILFNRSEEMLNLIKTHREENRGFRSKDNLNFDTVKDELTSFKDVTLEKFNSYVVQSNISKSRPEFMNKLSYLIDKNEIKYDKKIQSSDIIKEALEKYDPQIAAIAFVPSVDKDNSFYMSRTKTGLDDLAKDSYSEGMEAARVSKRIDEYELRLEKLSGAKDSNEEILKSTDEYLNSILSEFKELSDKIYKLDNEYLKYKTENYFSYKIANKSKPIKLSIIIKFAILGFIMSLIIIIYMEFVHEFIYKKTRNAKKAIFVVSKIRKSEDR